MIFFVFNIQKHDHPAYGVKHGMTVNQWWSEFVVRVFNAAGYSGDQKALSRVADALIEHFYHDSTTWVTLPGASDILQYLNSSGFKLGVVSNSDDSTLPMLQTHNLANYFDFVVNSANTGLEKPNPEIFRRALKASGGINPDEAGHVGDDLKSDYQAPRKLGMTAFLLNKQNRYSDVDLVDVDHKCIITDLSELKHLVELKQ